MTTVPGTGRTHPVPGGAKKVSIEFPPVPYEFRSPKHFAEEIFRREKLKYAPQTAETQRAP